MIFSGASLSISFVAIFWSSLISSNISCFSSANSSISSIYTNAERLSISGRKKVDICFVNKFGSPFNPYNPRIKVYNLSPDENPVSLIVSSSTGVWAYVYFKSIVDLYFLLALAN